MEKNANNDLILIDINSCIVGKNYIFTSEDLPDLYIKNKNYDAAYIQLSYAIEPMLAEIYKEDSSKVKINFIFDGYHTLH